MSAKPKKDKNLEKSTPEGPKTTPKSKPETPLTEVSAKIDQTDEMKLQMLAALEREGVQPQAVDALFPPELNAQLLDQLKVMTGEKNQLRQLNFEKDTQIKEMQATIAELNKRIRDIISGTGPTISTKSAGVISSKITELCKQNRHLIAEVESYKTKNGALERKIANLELINKEHEKLHVCVCNEEAALDVDPEEFKELNIKLTNVNKRLIESKRKNIELKNEIVAATKILQQELGCKFTSLKEIVNDCNGWKGRAEKIVLLQARVKELEDILQLNEQVHKTRNVSVEDNIKEIEAKRKLEMEQALKEYNDLKEENQALKKKVEAAKCRVRNVECEQLILKQKMQTYADKSNADDLLINEQRIQIKALENYYQEIVKEYNLKIQKLQDEIEEFRKSNANTAAKMEALRTQASEKAKKIEELRSQLHRYEECSLQSVFFNPMRTAKDNEIQKLSELIVTLNERLEKERHKWEELDTSHKKLRERKKALERKVTALQDEITQLQESRRGSRMSKFSIQKSTKSTSSSQSTAAAEQTSKQSSTIESEGTESIDALEKDALKYKYLLTEEKLKSLQDKLKMLEEEKHEDYVHLTEMIANSKQLFTDALKVLQKQKCFCNVSQEAES